MSLIAQPEDKYLQSQGVDVAATSAHNVSYVGSGPCPQPTIILAPSRPHRGLVEAYILGIPFGFLGAHHWYLRRYSWGLLYLCTVGLFGIGWVVDWFRMPCLVQEANQRMNNPTPVQTKSLADAYVLWLPCGLFGFHHFYLNRPCWGIAYLCTVGGFGIGWIIDGFRMPCLVKSVNVKLLHEDHGTGHSAHVQEVIRQGDAYCLAVCPVTGLLGGHHYYLGRSGFGALYTCTLGLLGVGWLVDLVRTPFLVKRINKEKLENRLVNYKHLDDAYLCLFPLGFLGLHHFYLYRHGWGVLYLFTLGCLGIGWIVDFFRLPCLVRQYNDLLEASQGLVIPPGPPTYIIHGAPSPGYSQGHPQAHLRSQTQGYPQNYLQGQGQGTFSPYHAGPPYPSYMNGVSNIGYGSDGFSSWTTVSSDPGPNTGQVDLPPSYNEALSQAPPPQGPIQVTSYLQRAPPPSQMPGPSAPPL